MDFFSRISYADLTPYGKFFILLGSYLVTRFLLVSLVKTWAVKDERNRRSWLFIAKRLPGFILLIGVLFIWGQELRDFALSLVAVAAALVLATKEVILCLMGGLLKASTKLFENGDRISVAGYRGKVIDHTLLTTTLIETGPGRSNQGTGKLLKVPNSMFLSNTVTVVPSGHHFIQHVISITMPLTPHWEKMEQLLFESAKDVSKNFKAEFDNFSSLNRNMVSQYSLDHEPRVIFDVNSKDTIEFQVRMTLPYTSLSLTESNVVRTFMRRVSENSLIPEKSAIKET